MNSEERPRLFGLIGFPVSHSFSKKYFEEKFRKEGITNCAYDLFPLEAISLLPDLIIAQPQLAGLNVTIPYKEAVLTYADEVDAIARKCGAANTLRIERNESHFRVIASNSDYYGFRNTLLSWLPHCEMKALVLGTGGSSKAVQAVLNDLRIPFQLVSREKNAQTLLYHELSAELMGSHRLIVNTTPLGMFPAVNSKPDIPYEFIGPAHFLYDLVYNPEETAFLEEGKNRGAAIKNGLEMLHAQAEASWEFWNR